MCETSCSSARSHFESDSGQLLFEISDGRQTYRLTIDRSHSTAQLTVEGGSEPLRSAALPAIASHKPFALELSIFDRQVIAAIDGNLLFPAWDCDLGHAEPPRKPLRIGACGTSVRISGLKVFRDIYYTRGQGATPLIGPSSSPLTSTSCWATTARFPTTAEAGSTARYGNRN